MAGRAGGGTLLKTGRTDEAIAELEAALRYRPEDADLHNNIAVALAGQGRLDEAIAHFSQALRIRPDYQEVRRNLDYARRLQKNSRVP